MFEEIKRLYGTPRYFRISESKREGILVELATNKHRLTLTKKTTLVEELKPRLCEGTGMIIDDYEPCLPFGNLYDLTEKDEALIRSLMVSPLEMYGSGLDDRILVGVPYDTNINDTDTIKGIGAKFISEHKDAMTTLYRAIVFDADDTPIETDFAMLERNDGKPPMLVAAFKFIHFLASHGGVSECSKK